MHIHETTLKLRQTDSAGIAYFTSVFDIAHECYESFLDIATILKEGKYLLPIVHAEADYRSMMELSDKITVQMHIEGTGRSSYTLAYTLINQKGETVAKAKTVHSVIDKTKGKSIEIPESIRTRLLELK